MKMFLIKVQKQSNLNIYYLMRNNLCFFQIDWCRLVLNVRLVIEDPMKGSFLEKLHDPSSRIGTTYKSCLLYEKSDKKKFIRLAKTSAFTSICLAANVNLFVFFVVSVYICQFSLQLANKCFRICMILKD